MRKLAKLSLVAAVAVAGLTNVNAASLEEAIKGVDVSGQFRFRANDRSDTTGLTPAAGNNDTDVEIEVGVKVPVTENVKAVFKIDTTRNTTDAGATKVTGTDNQDYLDIEDYYFSYNQGAITVNAGQQNIPGRITDGAQGDGVVALYNLGNVTVGAAAFANNSLSTEEDVYSVIAMGTFGPVSVLGQYADVVDAAKTFNLKADASVAMIKIGAEYTESEIDMGHPSYTTAALADDRSTAKAYVSAKVGIVSAKLSYAKTGDNGSGSVAEELEAPAEALLWNVGTSGRDDYSAFTIDASVAVTPAISLRAAYSAGEEGNRINNDVTEALGQITYKVAKNLTTYVRFADVEDKGSDYTRGRVEARYSF
ncbi:porin [Poseidonibacter ostreae]|uniref:Porin n=1 Tax=Poseidonibacter ostreae TaxID=2654171 RepID=A0A6L4WV34_9BACT|nr:porin [Poseidonibacter ostreae]KAB7888699.1 porin [Poseidonibacter ostreae]KAB7892476.1 porin [Poseidonibacter ostreae]